MGAGVDGVNTQRPAKAASFTCHSAAACTESVADTMIWLILSIFRGYSWPAAAARSVDAEKFTGADRIIAAVTHNPDCNILGVFGLGKNWIHISTEGVYGI